MKKKWVESLFYRVKRLFFKVQLSYKPSCLSVGRPGIALKGGNIHFHACWTPLALFFLEIKSICITYIYLELNTAREKLFDYYNAIFFITAAVPFFFTKQFIWNVTGDRTRNMTRPVLIVIYHREDFSGCLF